MRPREKGEKKQPELCGFSCIKVKVPRLRLVKLFWKRDFLSLDEQIFLKGLLWRAESAENQIRHIKSMVERALIKSK